MLASLKHPNIAAIYGVAGSDRIGALVMDPVEGKTLAERIARTQPLTRECAAMGLILKGRTFAGSIDRKRGKRLACQLVVTNVSFGGMDDLIRVFQDGGTISTVLWRDN